jgi:dTDP-4-dehydrorhamnose reductase
MERQDIELWAGAECSFVRVGERVVDQLESTGHGDRIEDIDRVAGLGVRAFRQAVLWETTLDWGWADERVGCLRELDVRPILGLLHHGSGPGRDHLLSPTFVDGLARHARAVAEHYPWVTDYTPVNEPLTTARFACLYGHWYPHARDDRAFARALVNECLATRASMRAIREVQPGARLVQTEDIGTVFATPRMAYQARFENTRRFLSLDLLAGRVVRSHPMWHWLVDAGGISERELDDLVADPVPPDIFGINYYVTSDRFLDEHVERYPETTHGGNGRDAYADVEAVRVRFRGIVGFEGVLRLVAWRYGRPVAITEAHLAGPPEEQVLWFAEAWKAAERARDDGLDVRAVTAWSVFGAYDWDSLLTRDRQRYEAGVFDVRGGVPRETPLASVVRELALDGSSSTHPLLEGEGWWAKPSRLLYPALSEAP